MSAQVVLINPDIPADIRSQLVLSGWNPVPVPYCETVLDPVKGHPDLQVCCIAPDEIVVQPLFPVDLYNQLENQGFFIRRGITELSRKYPADIPFNGIVIGSHFFHFTDVTDPILRERIAARGYTPVRVKQGYTCCSVLQVSDNAIITSDNGVAQAVRERGIDVLPVERGYVRLPGMSTGFIGGTGGWDGADTVYVCGSIDLHPSAQQMREFIKKHDKRLVCLGADPLTDYGSLLFIHH